MFVTHETFKVVCVCVAINMHIRIQDVFVMPRHYAGNVEKLLDFFCSPNRTQWNMVITCPFGQFLSFYDIDKDTRKS